MPCEAMQDTIHTWLDNSSQAMPPMLKDHLPKCSVCRNFISTWSSVEVSLTGMRDDHPVMSRDFKARLDTRIADDKGRSWLRWPSFAKPAWAGAAVAVVAVVVWLSMANRPNAQRVANNNNGVGQTLPMANYPSR